MTDLPGGLHFSRHPLVRHKIAHMQNRDISSQQFYRLMKELGMLLAYEATAHLPLKDPPPFTREEDAPLGQVLAGYKPVIVPVLRSGLALAEGFREVMPLVRTGHLGIVQGPDHKPIEYLVALPETSDRPFIVVDGIIATGESAVRAAKILVEDNGVAKDQLLFCVALSTKEGANKLLKEYPEIQIIAGSEAEFIGNTKDVKPWIGHVGNRLFFGERPK